MAKKNFFDKIAEGLVLGKDDKIRELNEDPKKKDSSEDSKDEKSEEETKDSKEETPKETEGNPESSKEEPKAEAKPEKDEPKSAEENPKPAPAPQPEPDKKGYTGTGDISGVKDLRQQVTINGDVQVTQYGGAALTQQPAVGEKLNAFVKSIEAIRFTRAEEDSFRNGDALYELNRATSEGEVPSAAVKFAELTLLKCPNKFSKLIRDHISEAVEADPELLTFIKETDARKHQIERRFQPFGATLSGELWTESDVRSYVEDKKSELPPSLAAKACDEDFGRWVWVEHNADTGVIRELPEAEAASHQEKWEEAQRKTSAKPNKKEAPARESKTEGEAS